MTGILNHALSLVLRKKKFRLMPRNADVDGAPVAKRTRSASASPAQNREDPSPSMPRPVYTNNGNPQGDHEVDPYPRPRPASRSALFTTSRAALDNGASNTVPPAIPAWQPHDSVARYAATRPSAVCCPASVSAISRSLEKLHSLFTVIFSLE